MKLRDLIKALKRFENEHGNLDVVVESQHSVGPETIEDVSLDSYTSKQGDNEGYRISEITIWIS